MRKMSRCVLSNKQRIEIAIEYIRIKKQSGERILYRSELRNLLFDQKTPSLGPIIRELKKQGLIKQFNSKSYIIC